MKVIVIGAGPAGCAAAYTAGKHGHEVRLFEAADSLGLDYWQAMRLIILPQALKISIPSIVNIAIGLFKDTTLVSIISMFDVLGMISGPILSSTEWFPTRLACHLSMALW